VRREFMRRSLAPGGRLLAVGDPRQAIYGFTGASHDAIELIKDNWEAEELPLSVCYRCPTAVVQKAKTLVDYIEPAPNAPEGAVRYVQLSTVLGEFQPSDAILCRNTAPLIDLAYHCIGKGIGCEILGRDIGKGLQAVIDKMKAENIDELEKRLQDYRTREVNKFRAKDQESRADALEDRVSCIFTVIDHLPEPERTLQGLQNALGTIFGDGTGVRLTLSTVHKAKGREWPRVGILQPELMPARWAKQDWQKAQEVNLQYVAWTRATEQLIFLEGKP
jgi:DNA helicase II / ATP-dependent DNA helicase PcrA